MNSNIINSHWEDKVSCQENSELSVILCNHPGCYIIYHDMRETTETHIGMLKNFDVKEAEEFIEALVDVGDKSGFLNVLEKYSYFEYHDIDFMYEGKQYET